MRVTIFLSDLTHPIAPYLRRLIQELSQESEIDLITHIEQLSSGDILFLVSCTNIVKPDEISGYQNTLVLHASDLPKGRGWSPHIWELLQGADHITVSLIEASELVDTGAIWAQKKIKINPNLIWDEINHLLFMTELDLIKWAILNHLGCKPRQQKSDELPTYYKKRIPKDSELDISKSIEAQFDLLRLSDPHRYPAFFIHKGRKYKLIMEKTDDD